ncbi:MAG: xanthine dehydrogenase small subunit [Lautropia sp.]
MQAASSPIRFFHRGAIREVARASCTRTVLDWLREDARRTGTKEGCNEGDCGACTVVIGTLAATGDPASVRGLRLETVNACLRFLPTLDGKALFTVDDLARAAPGAAPELHPVQQAMVRSHASQCGFCTPGFVMSLWALYEQTLAVPGTPRLQRQRIADELSGNLCRCTGYRPILDAGEAMFDGAPVRLDTVPVVAALEALRAARDDARRAGGEGFVFAGTDGRFHAPASVDALAKLRAELPHARLFAGATDVALWVNKSHRLLGDLIWLGEVEGFAAIERRPGLLRVGAAASLDAAFGALVDEYPSLSEVWMRFASPPVRHAGTMGGNLANGSPIGDAAPVLMVLDARLELRAGDVTREVPLEAFYVDYMKNVLAGDEFVQAILVPLPIRRREVRAWKVSKRFDCDISAVCGAFALELDAGVVKSVRIAFGGMAATVRRATKTEAALVGRAWDKAAIDAAVGVLAEEFSPLSDMRASAKYRRNIACRLLLRFWLETRLVGSLAPGQVSVFAPMAQARRQALLQRGDA